MKNKSNTFTFPGAYPGQHVELTFYPLCYKKPDSVLVFAFHEKKLLFTHHKKRGWELPGGSINQGESPQDAAIREVYEETGAKLQFVNLLGQYTINSSQTERHVKTIFFAPIIKFHPIPKGFETNGRQLLIPPSPEKIIADPEFSVILKDDVYRHCISIAKHVCAINLKKSSDPGAS